jgi:hypothetical protein
MANSIGSCWRQAAAAVVVAVLALSTVTTGVLAQDDATPPAGSPPNAEEPAAVEGSSPGATAAEKTRLAAEIQALTDAIALVQTDRDAVASQIDTAEIDALLVKATELRDAAQASLETDDVSTAPRTIMAGMQTTMAAQALLEAELTDFGLPSQQGRASHVLVGAYYAIDEASALATTETEASPDADAAFFLATAQRLYERAYEQYNAGTYAQAERTALVAQQVAVIGGLLRAEVPAGDLPGASTSKTDAAGRPGVDRAEVAGVARSEGAVMPANGMPPATIDGFGSATIVLAPSDRAERDATGDETILVVPEPDFE